MAYTVAFSTNQVIGASNEIVIIDASSGSDGTVSTRRVYLVTSTGQYLTESGLSDSIAYTTWPLADGNTLTLDVLTNATVLDVTLAYVTAGGAVANGATLTVLQGFPLYAEEFYYSLTQAQAQQNTPPPTILQDTNYYMQKMMLRVNIDSGNNAITYGDDIVSAQNCYNLANYQIENQADFF